MAAPKPMPPPPGSAGAPGPTLLPGQVLAGRFRIVRGIAQGGMGEVWEAEDLEFVGERVAVKTIRPEIARDAWAVSRFRREIQLSKKVTHPNVCRVFDLFRHEASGEGPDQRITFLTMELLPGETLAARIARTGPLPQRPAAEPLVRQMAAALAAAHAAGVVHGDFKSSNVMGFGEGEGARAVVTDFGLARGGGPGGDHPRGEKGHDARDFAGTPAYMAPEQVQGGGPSVAGDLYALGVVLYEMVTGRRPFADQTPFGAAPPGARPPSPRRLAPDLDPAWERTLLRCLAPDPEDRFGSAEDVARALAGEPVSPVSRTSPAASRRPLRTGIGIAAAVLLAAAAVGAWRQVSGHFSPKRPSPPAGSARPVHRRPVPVLGFKNLSGRPDASWLSVALSEMLATDLAAGGRLRLIPAETVARMEV